MLKRCGGGQHAPRAYQRVVGWSGRCPRIPCPTSGRCRCRCGCRAGAQIGPLSGRSLGVLRGADPRLTDGAAGVEVLREEPTSVGLVRGHGVKAAQQVQTAEDRPTPAVEDALLLEHEAGIERDELEVPIPR